ncbi:unnamed protein product [Rotaria socialis]|uniref:Gustatory receptor n=1 Tax=Rotaria socialis TaxID=392032 RepID=A0A818E1U0_9BILA|nr:unnamed protein product [Rotaria socialis]CAF3220733.1 unnamed protein product [Rotaria socialis]CAF3451011.1 unnamed protein product [Rotaria socialis]CAF3488434.1 unnamed protein product [Rotaria socialis]CAF3720018.1 unnamed protein product [Rotaria socialis]
MNKHSNTSPKPAAFSIANSYHNYINQSMNNEDDFGCIKVEISDLDNSCPNQTTLSLMRCKKQIIHPFRSLLCLIGWRPFGADSLKRSSILLRIFNIIYPIFILILLLFNYTYEIIVCQGKLNVVTDTKTTTTTTSTTSLSPSQNHTLLNWSSLIPPKPFHKINVTDAETLVCGHIFTTYILPDLLHFIAFIIGFIYFRTTEGEPMYSLMEKVFIHADQNMRQFSPNRVIRRLKIFLLIGIVWVLASVATHALSNAMNDFTHPLIFDTQNNLKGKSVRYSLFILDIVCLLISNCIHLTIVINFVTHCEMVVFYSKSIRTRLEEKSIHLLEAMKQILDLGQSISQLNSLVSRMMSILIVYYLERTILGIILLMANEIKEPIMYAYRALYPMVWFSILLFCLGEAARVTSKCDKFHRVSLGMRVYGYHAASYADLDGFLLFLSKAELRAKLFGLTVRPGKIIFILVTTMIICVILLQTNIIKSSNFFLQ